MQVLNQGDSLVVAFMAGVPILFITAFKMNQASVSLVMLAIRRAKKA